MARVLGGIFVGGAATRFGGIAKGLLPAPDGAPSLVARTVALLRAHEVEPVLVGNRAEYTHLTLPALADLAGEGPLGGLRALYAHASARGVGTVLVLACDMPFLASLGALLAHAPGAPLVAPRRGGRWEPFFSRHAPETLAPLAAIHAAEGRSSLQALFDAAPASPLDVPAEELEDWDSPEDTR